MPQEQKLELERELKQQNCNTPPITPTKTPQKPACPPTPRKRKQVESITDSLAGDEKVEVDSSLSLPLSSSDENWQVAAPPQPTVRRRLFLAGEEASEARKIEAQKRFDEFHANQASKAIEGSSENNNNNATDGKKGTGHYSPSTKKNEQRGKVPLQPSSTSRNSFKRKRSIYDERRLSAYFYWLTMMSGATIKSEIATYEVLPLPKTTMLTFPLPADGRQENATTVDALRSGAGFRMFRPRNPSNKELSHEQKKGQIISTYVMKK